MEVYIVHYREDWKEIDDITGVYSSEEKAEETIAKLKEESMYREGRFDVSGGWTLDK